MPPSFSSPLFEARWSPEHLKSLSSSYQAVTLAVPGRKMNRGDTWPSRTTLLLDSGKKKMAMELTCKYQGRREVNGKPQAMIRLSGHLKAVGPESGPASPSSDVVAGYALFDLEAGYYSKVYIKVRPEFENEGLTQKRFEATLEREKGNAYNIAPPAAGVKSNDSSDSPDGRNVEMSRLTDAALDGLWVLDAKESKSSSGKFYVNGFEEAIKIEGDMVTWVKKSGDYQTTYPPAEIALNTSRNPRFITFTSTGPLKKWLAIYKIEGDKLFIATNLEKDRRPSLFITKQAAGPGAAWICASTNALKPGEYAQKPPVETQKPPVETQNPPPARRPLLM